MAPARSTPMTIFHVFLAREKILYKLCAREDCESTEIRKWKSTTRKNTRKIISNNMHVRVPMLNTQVRLSIRDNICLYGYTLKREWDIPSSCISPGCI
ncbi:hypothetical protein H8356DRAFT_1328709 [Neocallimastix lanati (nom. inval.)]|nr:hypothetical protein H8356DRAFT_1328709 [Neocallimastix sp. JGI-2020a]